MSAASENCEPKRWHSAGGVLLAFAGPWLGAAILIAGLHACFASRPLPHFEGWSLIYGWLIAFVAALLLLVALFGYESFFRWLACGIVAIRPRGGPDGELDIERLLSGIPAQADGTADPQEARAILKRLKERLGESPKEDAATGTPARDLDELEGVMERIAGQRCPAKSDRKALFDRMTSAVAHMQGAIDVEFSAIAARVGWVLASQAFLLAAFVAVVGAERLTPSTRFWLALGIALTAAVISFVMALAAALGHALINKLRGARDKLERRLHLDFGLQPRGVPLGSAMLLHSATRYVPCVMYVGWVVLALAVLANLFRIVPSPAGLQAILQGPVRMSHGWSKYHQASPTFEPRKTEYLEKAQRNSNCPTSADAAQWVDAVVAAWKKRHEPGSDDVLVLVGGADRTRLGEALQKQIDSNMLLARERAEHVRDLLVKATAGEPAAHRIAPERVLITVTGPRIGHSRPKGAAPITDCSDAELNADRTVEVWLPGLLSKPNSEAAPPRPVE